MDVSKLYATMIHYSLFNIDIINFLCIISYGYFLCTLDGLVLVRTIAKRAIFGLFALTKPVIFCLGAIESERFMTDSHFSLVVCSITEWLGSTPPTSAPHIRSPGFAMVSERPLVVYVTRLRGVECVDCFNSKSGLEAFHECKSPMSRQRHLVFQGELINEMIRLT